MVLVRMDIDELKGAVSDLHSFWDKAMDQWTAAANASARALADTSQTSSALSTHLIATSTLWKDLQARIDLAILVNTGDDGHVPSGVVTYTLPGTDESIEAVKQALGEELARLASSEHSTEGRDGLKNLDDQLARYEDDAAVMSAFFDELGPAGLFDVMADTADQFMAEDLELRQSILDHIKAGLHTADASWPPSRSQAYADALVNAATVPPDEYSEHWSEYSSALSFLLYDSSYSDAFLTAAANGIDAYERVARDGEPGMWSGRMLGPNAWGQYFPETSVSASWDPSVSLMTALANNADVSLDFFSSGDDTNGPNDREKYWIHDRTWDDDQFSALSGALAAATTDPSVLTDPARARQAAELASHTVNLIGHRPGLEADDLLGDLGATDASENFARILATYMVGADQAVYSGTEIPWDRGSAMDLEAWFMDGTLATTPLFNDDSLNAFIVLASSTKDGMTTLRGGLDTYADRKYGLALDEVTRGTETSATNWQKAYESQGALEGFFVRAVGDSAIAEAEDEKAAREMWVSLASDGVGLIPFGGLVTRAGGSAAVETVVSFAIDQGRDKATDAVNDSWSDVVGSATDQQTQIAEDSLERAKYQAARALVNQGGLVEPDPSSALWRPDGTLIPWSEVEDLDPTVRARDLDRLYDADTGTGLLLDKDEFDSRYRDKFDDYYQKK